jgi:hypothetical protein
MQGSMTQCLRSSRWKHSPANRMIGGCAHPADVGHDVFDGAEVAQVAACRVPDRGEHVGDGSGDYRDHGEIPVRVLQP